MDFGVNLKEKRMARVLDELQGAICIWKGDLVGLRATRVIKNKSVM